VIEPAIGSMRREFDVAE